MKKNRREIPSEFTCRKFEAGSAIFGFNEDATLVSYTLKKNRRVVVLSSEHNQSTVNTKTGKPDIILAYNHGKGGVDHLNQMCAAYTTRKRTERWPKCVFQHMVDVSAFNAFVLWREATGRQKTRRREFLKMLGAQLCGSGLDESGNILQLAVAVAPTPTSAPSTRLRCRNCKLNKTTQRCKMCANPLCINCSSYVCPDC